MALLIIVAVLTLEQWRTIEPEHPVYMMALAWQRGCERLFFAGQTSHACLSYALAVGLPSLLIWCLQDWAFGLSHWDGFAGLFAGGVFSVLVLYFCLGMRQFSAQFSATCAALGRGDIAQAQQRFAAWDKRSVQPWSANQIYHLAVNKGLSEVHIHVLGVLCAWVLGTALGLGVAAAVLYRLAASMQLRQQLKLQQTRALDASLAPHALQALSQRCWSLIDWLPARSTALAFAVAGSFEDAIAAWRSGAWRNAQDTSHLSTQDGSLVQAVAKGALQWQSDALVLPEAGEHGDWEQGHIRSVVGLVWRAIVLWILLIALVELAYIWPSVSSVFGAVVGRPS